MANRVFLKFDEFSAKKINSSSPTRAGTSLVPTFGCSDIDRLSSLSDDRDGKRLLKTRIFWNSIKAQDHLEYFFEIDYRLLWINFCVFGTCEHTACFDVWRLYWGRKSLKFRSSFKILNTLLIVNVTKKTVDNHLTIALWRLCHVSRFCFEWLSVGSIGTCRNPMVVAIKLLSNSTGGSLEQCQWNSIVHRPALTEIASHRKVRTAPDWNLKIANFEDGEFGQSFCQKKFLTTDKLAPDWGTHTWS